MIDLKALLKPDKGQPATLLHLVDKKGFETWLKEQPARVRKAVEAQGFKGEGYPARHPARRAGRMGGGARRRQCRGAQRLVPRQGGGEPAGGDVSRRRARPRAGGARLAARPVQVRALQEGAFRQGAARAADRRAGPDRRDRAPRRGDLSGPRPGEHPGRRSRPGRAGNGGAGARRRERGEGQCHPRRGADRRLSDDRRGGPRRRARPRAPADRAGTWRPAPSAHRHCRQGRLLRQRRARHQALVRHAPDEEGHGRRRACARPRAADHQEPAAGPSPPPDPGGRECRVRRRLPPGRHTEEPQRAHGRGRQYRCGRPADPRRRVDPRARGEARADRRLRDPDRRRASRPRAGPPGPVRQ